ncbi:MAG: bifunctional folylpolyglutamate synthase/dihydrofolate synthase [Desulfobulbus sp.]|nr:bifunctional folylpolyglutamate synthase/dihydrofolate synthase [Desulfobulbus sp.]
MTYQEACAWLDQHQFFKIKLGLETTRELLHALGDPQDTLKIIHIAGTNGKGSVGATLLACLGAGGYRTGFYSSPHLHSVRERFRIGNTWISEADFTELINELAHFIKRQPHPTYFELTTILALLWFSRQKAEVIILETGMGGRLDATNVVTPLVSIITDISRDHEQYLGNTIAAIAGEKAGIIKPGLPVVFSGREPEALPVIVARCLQQKSPLYLFGRDFHGQAVAEGLDYTALAGSHHHYPLRLSGAHQGINTSLALGALEILQHELPLSQDQIRTGLDQVKWPGRMELVHATCEGKNRRILFDGAHNEAGVTQLCQSLSHGFPRDRLLLIWGNMADKAMGPAFERILAFTDSLILTRAESERSADPQTLKDRLPQCIQEKAHCIEPAESALEHALALSTEYDLICVSGSLYLVGILRHLLLKKEA